MELFDAKIAAIVIECDSSNKIERLEKTTILAFSNNKLQCSIVIPASVKRDLFAVLQGKGKSRKNAYLWIFSAGLFLLFKPNLTKIIKRNELIVIDQEYTGHDANIKSMFLRHCWNRGFSLRSEMISFARIGKSSNAHKLAYSVHKGEIEADQRVAYGEFLKLL